MRCDSLQLSMISNHRSSIMSVKCVFFARNLERLRFRYRFQIPRRACVTAWARFPPIRAIASKQGIRERSPPAAEFDCARNSNERSEFERFSAKLAHASFHIKPMANTDSHVTLRRTTTTRKSTTRAQNNANSWSQHTARNNTPHEQQTHTRCRLH